MFDTTANRYLSASLSSVGSTSGYSCISGNNSKYRSCIRNDARGRFYTVVDLVNRLEAEARGGRQGRLAEYLALDL
jgi:hypothetical protein